MGRGFVIPQSVLVRIAARENPSVPKEITAGEQLSKLISEVLSLREAETEKCCRNGVA